MRQWFGVVNLLVHEATDFTRSAYVSAADKTCLDCTILLAKCFRLLDWGVTPCSPTSTLKLVVTCHEPVAGIVNLNPASLIIKINTSPRSMLLLPHAVCDVDFSGRV